MGNQMSEAVLGQQSAGTEANEAQKEKQGARCLLRERYDTRGARFAGSRNVQDSVDEAPAIHRHVRNQAQSQTRTQNLHQASGKDGSGGGGGTVGSPDSTGATMAAGRGGGGGGHPVQYLQRKVGCAWGGDQGRFVHPKRLESGESMVASASTMAHDDVDISPCPHPVGSRVRRLKRHVASSEEILAPAASAAIPGGRRVPGSPGGPPSRGRGGLDFSTAQGQWSDNASRPSSRPPPGDFAASFRGGVSSSEGGSSAQQRLR
ncbi:unnamed protein product, partial [Discosporangium mesarthrocarpum]